MIFAVGVLYSSRTLLEFIKTTPITPEEFLRQFGPFDVASPEHILEAAKIGRWIRALPDGRIGVTERGERILQAKTPESALCLQLKYLIASARPPWASLIAKGRSEARPLFPPAVLQCFEEAGLFGDPTDQVVEWWSILASAAIGREEETRRETGFQGERLSIEYERLRTGQTPFWQSMESSDAGYDLLSKVSPADARPLLIEVKTSLLEMDDASFFISRNEWNVAQKSENYVVYFWALRPEPRLFIIPIKKVGRHVPMDQGLGYWKQVRIPISPFSRHAVDHRIEKEAQAS